MLPTQRVLLLLSVAVLLREGAPHSTLQLLRDFKNRLFNTTVSSPQTPAQCSGTDQGEACLIQNATVNKDESDHTSETLVKSKEAESYNDSEKPDYNSLLQYHIRENDTNVQSPYSSNSTQYYDEQYWNNTTYTRLQGNNTDLQYVDDSNVTQYYEDQYYNNTENNITSQGYKANDLEYPENETNYENDRELSTNNDEKTSQTNAARKKRDLRNQPKKNMSQLGDVTTTRPINLNTTVFTYKINTSAVSSTANGTYNLPDSEMDLQKIFGIIENDTSSIINITSVTTDMLESINGNPATTESIFYETQENTTDGRINSTRKFVKESYKIENCSLNETVTDNILGSLHVTYEESKPSSDLENSTMYINLEMNNLTELSTNHFQNNQNETENTSLTNSENGPSVIDLQLVSDQRINKTGLNFSTTTSNHKTEQTFINSSTVGSRIPVGITTVMNNNNFTAMQSTLASLQQVINNIKQIVLKIADSVMSLNSTMSVNKTNNSITQNNLQHIEGMAEHHMQEGLANGTDDEGTKSFSLAQDNETINALNETCFDSNLSTNSLMESNDSISNKNNSTENYKYNNTTDETEISKERSTERGKRSLVLTIGEDECRDTEILATVYPQTTDGSLHELLFNSTDSWNETTTVIEVVGPVCYKRYEQCTNTTDCCENLECVEPNDKNSTSHCDLRLADVNISTSLLNATDDFSGNH